MLPKRIGMKMYRVWYYTCETGNEELLTITSRHQHYHKSYYLINEVFLHVITFVDLYGEKSIT